jgi:hypothetical protein
MSQDRRILVKAVKVLSSAIADAGEFARDASMGVRYPNARVHTINPLQAVTRVHYRAVYFLS